MNQSSDLRGWKLVGGSIAGTSHLREGRGSDDALAWMGDDGRLVVAIADGAGSARRGGDGAAVAVAAGLQASWRHLERGLPASEVEWRSFLAAAVDDARRSVLELDGDSPSEFATTLMLIAWAGGTIAAVHIGDGGIVVERAGGHIETLSRGRHGEFVNETYFLTGDDVAENSELFVLPDDGVEGFVAFTDGVQSMAFDGVSQPARAGFFAPILDFARQPDASQAHLERFLGSERVCNHTTDDKTMFVAVRS